MTNKNKRIINGMNVGSSSILVTFVLLCLITFAALSFVSANSDYKLSVQSADRLTNYYEASHMAEVYLLNIDSQLKMLSKECNSQEDYLSKIEDTFNDNDSINTEIIDDDYYISYSIVISDSQKLCVKLLAVYPENETSDSFIIKEWETVSTYDGKEGAADDGMGFIF